MTKDSNLARLSLRPTAELNAYLERLAKLGIHGKTRADVALNLLSREIERLITQGFIRIEADDK